jgi:CBS domain-containing protein
MQIAQMMTRGVTLTDPSTTIRDAARTMRDENIGALPVGENDRLVGMVTDRDIAMRGVADDKAPGACTVREVMSEHVYYVFEDEDENRAADVMAEHQVRRLPVLNRDKRLVGIVAMADLARTAGEPTKTAAGGVSQPSDAPRH